MIYQKEEINQLYAERVVIPKGLINLDESDQNELCKCGEPLLAVSINKNEPHEAYSIVKEHIDIPIKGIILVLEFKEMPNMEDLEPVNKFLSDINENIK